MSERRSHLVSQHIERMSRSILEQHPDVIREYVKGKRGVYALYKGARLYYVGLASNLRSRLTAHVRDRHAGAWDYFSMYLTDGERHLRELEALVLRITMPRGNLSKTKFARSQDLRRYFRHRIAETQRAELEGYFAPRLKRVRAPGRRERGSRSRRQHRASGGTPLAAYVTAPMQIRKTYKGRLYRAVVRGDGTIRFLGRVFNSPSQAAVAVAHRPINGWNWWKYEAAPGEGVPLDALRRR